MPHLSKKYEGRAVVAKVNTDVQQYLSGSQWIRALPTVVVYKDWKEVERATWLRPPEWYSEVLDRHLED
jgi:thioredoxin 1